MTTTTAAWYRVQGDANDTLTATFNGVQDLLGISAIEAHVWRNDVASTTLTATVTDAAARTVSVDLGSWITTAAPAVYFVEIQATWTGSPAKVVTSPAKRGTATIVVRAQGA
jgi:hypothetical protein